MSKIEPALFSESNSSNLNQGRGLAVHKPRICAQAEPGLMNGFLLASEQTAHWIHRNLTTKWFVLNQVVKESGGPYIKKRWGEDLVDFQILCHEHE